jgi:hypothetical protein
MFTLLLFVLPTNRRSDNVLLSAKQTDVFLLPGYRTRLWRFNPVSMRTIGQLDAGKIDHQKLYYPTH